MKEIGGYPEIEQMAGREYYPEASRFNTARSALLWLVRQRKIKKLFLPAYLCPSVRHALAKSGFEKMEFYEVDPFFRPVFDRPAAEGEWLYLVNYYGQLGNDFIGEVKERYQNLIVDNVQAFFQRPLAHTDTLYSCRKWFGVPDGAYLSTDLAAPCLEKDFSAGRLAPLFGRAEEGAETFFALHQKIEQSLDEAPVKGMSRLTQNLLCGADYGKAQARRNENFDFLHHALKEKNELALCRPEGAFYYPFKTKNAPEIRSFLISQKIFVPKLWPDTPDERATSILPLPVDQRYAQKEMEQILKALQEKTALLPAK